MKVYTTTHTDATVLTTIQAQLSEMGLDFLCEKCEAKVTQKWLTTVDDGSLLIEDTVYLLVNGMKVSPNWLTLQQRIVTAGKKTELLLQASKLTQEKTVIDATAGFGHDSLILASTGAAVTMIEQNPIMYLLLRYEIQKMQVNPNWQKLLNRLTLYFGNASQILPSLTKADLIYLDPMFPEASYKSAQVGKQMQILHRLSCPPTMEEEALLLTYAQERLNPTGRVVVKRPKKAPYLAAVPPQESWENAVIRYDGYLNPIS